LAVINRQEEFLTQSIRDDQRRQLYLILFSGAFFRYSFHTSESELAKQSSAPNPGAEGFPLLSEL